MTDIRPEAQAPATPAGNGLAVAALVLGIIGVFFGIIPLTFFVAWILGVLALVFGLVGCRRRVRRAMAVWGAALGLVSLILGVVGVVIVVRAVEEFGEALEELDEVFSEPPCTELIDGQRVPAVFIDDFGDLDLSCELGDSLTLSIPWRCFGSDREYVYSDYGWAYTDDKIFHRGDPPENC